jgi:hypothetical protein
LFAVQSRKVIAAQAVFSRLSSTVTAIFDAKQRKPTQENHSTDPLFFPY